MLTRDFTQPYEYTTSRCEGEDINPIFDLIQERFLHIFTPELEFEKLVSALFILETITFQRFEAYPNLRVYIPRICNQKKGETLFKNLCFNGITVTGSFDLLFLPLC